MCEKKKKAIKQKICRQAQTNHYQLQHYLQAITIHFQCHRQYQHQQQCRRLQRPHQPQISARYFMHQLTHHCSTHLLITHHSARPLIRHFNRCLYVYLVSIFTFFKPKIIIIYLFFYRKKRFW